MARVIYPLITTGRPQSDYNGERPALTWWGAKGDTQIFAASCTAASAVVTSVPRTGTGTLSSSGATVTGSGTSFLAEIQVGTFITSDGQTRKVLAVISDTELLTATAFAPALSADAFTIFVGFDAEDVGKRMVIRGAGSGSDRESLINGNHGPRAAQESTNSWAVVAGFVVDTQAGTEVKIAGNSGGNTVEWELFGSNAADFSGEASVHGPEDLVVVEPSLAHTPGAPAFRYYRAKIKSKVSGEHGIAYITGLVMGRLLGATISTVDSPSQVTLSANAGATISAAYAYFGTDDTAAIQKAIDVAHSLVPAQTADGGLTLQVPRGVYLISSPITHQGCVVVKGPSAGAAIFLADGEAFPADVPVWNMTGLWNGSNIAFFTRLEDVRIDCAHVPGSIGIYCDSLQENSGLYRVTCMQWRSIGVKVGDDAHRYGCSNWIIEDLWCYPSLSAFMDDDVCGITLEYSTDTTIRRCTVLGQGGFIGGFGRAVHVFNTPVNISRLHTESARIGVHFDEGSGGVLDGFTGHYFVTSAVTIETGNPVSLRNVRGSGKYTLTDAGTGTFITDYWLSEYCATSLPVRIRGGYTTGRSIMEIYPGAFYQGQPSAWFDLYGNFLASGDPSQPNVIARNAVNFGGVEQGGFDSINSRYAGFPRWEKSSENASDEAAFHRLGASMHELRFGKADQPAYVAEGTANVAGTAFTKVTGDDLDTGWPAGTQVVIGGNVFAFASVSSTTSATLSSSAGTLTGAAFGVTTDDEGLGGTNPGKSWQWTRKDFGTWLRRLWAEGSLPVEIGNNLDDYRFRIYQGGVDQQYLYFERSANSGSSWQVMFQLDLINNLIILPTQTASRPLKCGAFNELATAKINVGDANDISAGGFAANDFAKWDGSKFVPGVPVPVLSANRPVITNGAGALISGDIDLGNAAHVTVPGASADVLVNDGSGAVSFITLANLGAFLSGIPISGVTSLQDALDDFETRISALETAITGKADTGTYSLSIDAGGSPSHGHTGSVDI